MKKSFMTRVIAVSLSAAMTFSLSAANMATASAATKYVALSAKSVTLKSGAKKTLKLKNNSLGWKVTSASSARKDVVTVTKKSTSVVLKAKNCKKTHKNVKVTVKLKTSKKKKNNTKKLVCKVTVKKVPTTNPDPSGPDTPVDNSVKISSATVTSKTNVDVKFSANVDRETLVKENFKIAEAGVTVENVEVRDGMTVTLTLAGAEAGKTYTLNVTGLKDADGKAVDALSTTFSMPADTTEGYRLKLSTSSDKNQIKADGYAELPIVCEVVDPSGNTVTNKDYTIRFTTDRGSFSRPDVVTASGKAENVLKSQALNAAQTAHVTAEIIRVEGTDEEGLRGKQGTIDINMTPILDSVVVNPVVGAESNYADRLTLFFQDPVEDDTYKTSGVIDRSLIKVEVYNGITAQQKNDMSFVGNTPSFTTEERRDVNGRVTNLKAVAENNRALQVLVSSPLANNRHIGVRVQITDPKTKRTSTYLEAFTLTDSETPRVLKVEPTGRRKLRVTYSEAVLSQKVAVGDPPTVADKAENYLVGGVALSDAKWGAANNATDIQVGSGLDGEPERNVVDITLGKKADNSYARFDVGSNLLTVQNVGDWASNTSGVNNIITTDSKNFTVEEDTTKPTIKEVEVQSPEQFLITFNAPVDKAESKDTFANDIVSDDGTAKSPSTNDNTSIIQLQEGGKNIGAKKGETDSKNPIRVTKISEEKYLVETTKDWTQVYTNLGGTNDDYFYSSHNYKFVIAADKLVNINNGEKNTSEVSFDLSNDPKMRAADTTAPSLVSMDWSDSTQKATVTFDEPVKVRNEGETRGLNAEGSTPSVKQSNSADNGIQQAIAQFISPKTGRTIKGKFDSFTDATDKTVVIVPEDDLTKSDDWTLHINGISDDYGNTATVSKTFEVTSAEAGFKVAWASVSTTREYGANDSTKKQIPLWNAGDRTAADNGDRYIFVKFTNAVPANSIVFDARNYSINSNQVPSDAYVVKGIKGYDDNSGIVDSVTIVIPRRSAYVIDQAAGGQNITLTISDRVTSSANQTLADLTEMALPYNHDLTESDNRISGSDAVFGDDEAEQYDKDAPANSLEFKDLGAYKTAIENAIKSDKYRKIILTGNIAGGLNVSRPVDIELNGYNIVGDVLKASFNDGATCKITNNGTGALGLTNGGDGQITSEWQISTANADWVIGSGVTCKDVNVRAMPSNTLTNNGTITTLRINTGNSDAKIVNNNLITKMEISGVSNKTVKILNTIVDGITEVIVDNPVTIELVDDDNNKGLNIVRVNAEKDVTLSIKDGTIKRLIGKTNDVVVKDDKDKVVNASESDLVVKVENTNIDSIVEAVAAKLKSEYAYTTSGESITVSKIVTDAGNTIDSNGSEIPSNYDIVVKMDTTYGASLISDDGRNKFAKDNVAIASAAEKTVTVYLVDKTKATTDAAYEVKKIKDIKLTKK